MVQFVVGFSIQSEFTYALTRQLIDSPTPILYRLAVGIFRQSLTVTVQKLYDLLVLA
jgi:hypothetical protein